MTAKDVLAELESLTAKRDKAIAAHAVASSQFAQAQAAKAKAEATLREQGFDPEKIDTELPAALQKLSEEIAASDAEVEAAMVQYKEIGAAFQRL